jgi:hypothetical protein
MERKYRGAQRMAALSFGKRERDLTLDREGDHETLSLYDEMVRERFAHAAAAMLARWKKRYPATRICPSGPHIRGTKAFGWGDRCEACTEFKLEQLRAEPRGRIARRAGRVQQSQHRPGARHERFYQQDHSRWPWVQVNRKKWVLQRSWSHLAGKLTNPDKLSKMPSWPESEISRERKRLEQENDRVIKEELQRRREVKAA